MAKTEKTEKALSVDIDDALVFDTNGLVDVNGTLNNLVGFVNNIAAEYADKIGPIAEAVHAVFDESASTEPLLMEAVMFETMKRLNVPMDQHNKVKALVKSFIAHSGQFVCNRGRGGGCRRVG